MSYEVSIQKLRDNMAIIERKTGEPNELNDNVMHHLNDALLHLTVALQQDIAAIQREVRGLRGALNRIR